MSEDTNRRNFIGTILKGTVGTLLLLAPNDEFMLVEVEAGKLPKTLARYSTDSTNPPDLRADAVPRGFPRKNREE